jgi:hypothetical protein
VIRRKRASKEDRRRQPAEINLLIENDERGRPIWARRGCSFPFLTSLVMVSCGVLLHLV